MARTSPAIQRIITLSSGASRGSNLLAIHRYFCDKAVPVEIACAVFSNANTPAITICKELGIDCQVISVGDIESFERMVLDLLTDKGVSLIALCGFMKQLSQSFIRSAAVPILNIHPALLPGYGGKGMYGMKVHEAVFAAQEDYSGATVHRVDPIYDNGTVIMQERVDIRSCLSPAEIAERVLQIEHRIYAPAIYATLTQT